MDLIKTKKEKILEGLKMFLESLYFIENLKPNFVLVNHETKIKIVDINILDSSINIRKLDSWNNDYNYGDIINYSFMDFYLSYKKENIS